MLKNSFATNCKLTTNEKDLFPLYFVWSNRLQSNVIFAKNAVSGRVEQFIYDKSRDGFNQVHVPEIAFDSMRFHRFYEFFRVGQTEIEGVTRIKRDQCGFIRKEHFNFKEKCFEPIAPAVVKLLGYGKMKVQKTEEEIEATSEKILSFPISEDKNNVSRISRKRKAMPESEKGFDEQSMSLEMDCGQTTHDFVKPEAREEIAGNKPKLSKRDIDEIRRIAELMGNPRKSSTSDDDCDDASYSDDDNPSFKANESSC